MLLVATPFFIDILISDSASGWGKRFSTMPFADEKLVGIKYIIIYGLIFIYFIISILTNYFYLKLNGLDMEIFKLIVISNLMVTTWASIVCSFFDTKVFQL